MPAYRPRALCVFLVVASLLFAALDAHAQGESAHWFFGQQAGAEFNDCSVNGIGLTPIWASEGSTAISDTAGNLLFFTDGATVWDKNWLPMPNGLGLIVDPSATQAALIVPDPASEDLYYVIHTDGYVSYYSHVDMTLNGGLGDVTTKNNILTAEAGEKLTAVMHANQKDVWIAMTEVPGITTEFQAVPLTASGFGAPIVTSSTEAFEYAGHMKFSPDGSMMAVTLTNNRLGLYDFNTTTGVISNVRVISVGSLNSIAGNSFQLYGLEFSPDGSKLYYTFTYLWEAYQLDVSLNTATAIAGSNVQIGSGFGPQWTLQLGRDGKIYCATTGGWPTVIHNPNLPGIACGYAAWNFQLVFGSFNFIGLPGFVATRFHTPTDIYPCSACQYDNTVFTLPINNADSVKWDFGDPLSGPNNTSTLGSPTHVYNDSGTYTIRLISHFPTFDDTIYKHLFVSPEPVVELGPDTHLCTNDTILLDATFPNATYQWNTGSTDSILQVTDSGTYIVTILTDCGPDSDTIYVEKDGIPDLGPDTIICPGDSIVLEVDTSFSAISWQDGSGGYTQTVTSGGTYWVEATGICGLSSDTVLIQDVTPPVIDLGSDTTICSGDTLSFDLTSPFTSYLWQDSSTSGTQDFDSTGLYSVTVTNACGTDSDSIDLLVIDPPQVNLGPDTFLCGLDSLFLFGSGTNTTFLWQNGSPDSTQYAILDGIYWLEATNQCGTVSDTMDLSRFAYPFVDFGQDSILCEADSALLDASNPDAIYLWFDSSNDSIYVVMEEGYYWVEVTNPCGVATDSIFYNYDDSVLFELGADTVLCMGDSLMLSTYMDPDNDHFWQDSSTLNTYLVLIQGTYWVLVNNVCGDGGDTILIDFASVPNPNLGPDTTFCEDIPLELDAFHDVNSNYQWSNGSGSPSITVSVEGLYWVRAENLCGVGQDSIFLEVETKLDFQFDVPDLLCAGQPIALSFPRTDDAILNWSTGDSDVAINVDRDGTYWLTAENTCGLFSDTVELSFDTIPTLQLPADTAICPGGDLVVRPLQASLNGSVLWEDGSSDSLAITEAGLYIAQNVNQCGSSADSFALAFHPAADAFLGNDQEICPGQELVLKTTTSAGTFAWDNGSSKPSRTIRQTGVYSLTLTNTYGCSDQDTVEVFPCPALWVPNAFTPNGNLKNDVFRPEGESVRDYSLKIFTRWGEQIFSTEDFETGWNGSYFGEEAPAGVYSWRITYIGADRREKVIAGRVTLIR